MALKFVMLHISKILCACVVAIPLNTAAAQSSVVRFEGIGKVRIGMSLSDLNTALHTSFSTPSVPRNGPATTLTCRTNPGLE